MCTKQTNKKASKHKRFNKQLRVYLLEIITLLLNYFCVTVAKYNTNRYSTLQIFLFSPESKEQEEINKVSNRRGTF